jgi:mono/diheme cytochrome c family protein
MANSGSRSWENCAAEAPRAARWRLGQARSTSPTNASASALLAFAAFFGEAGYRDAIDRVQVRSVSCGALRHRKEGYVTSRFQLMGRLLALWGIFLVVPATGLAAEADDYGKKLYLQYCSACHGPDGKGDGVVSQFMRPKPADLTQLAKKAGGKFPFYDVVRTIDGRETVRAHGDPDMPVWGRAVHEGGGGFAAALRGVTRQGGADHRLSGDDPGEVAGVPAAMRGLAPPR